MGAARASEVAPADRRRAGALPSSRTAKARPELRVLSRADLARRRERRRARRLIGLSSIVVAGALGLVTGANSFVAADQLHVDSLQSQVAAAISTNQSLQLQKADLEAPSRILSIAKGRLDMIEPSGVTYLTPVTNSGLTPNTATPAASSTGRIIVSKADATRRASSSASAKR